jgi:hypothetical protein
LGPTYIFAVPSQVLKHGDLSHRSPLLGVGLFGFWSILLGHVVSLFSPFWCPDAKGGEVVLLELSRGIFMVGYKLVAICSLLELLSVYL